MKDACRRLGFAQHFSPHQLRRGGASISALEKVHDARGIKHRGRWASTGSVCRCIKHGVYLRTRGALQDPDPDFRRAHDLQSSPVDLLKRWPQAQAQPMTC